MGFLERVKFEKKDVKKEPDNIIKITILTLDVEKMDKVEKILSDDKRIMLSEIHFSSAMASLFYWQQQEVGNWPHLLLIDSGIQQNGCIETIERFVFLNRDLKIIVFGENYDEKQFMRFFHFFHVGAKGYIDLNARKKEWGTIIKEVCGNQQYCVRLNYHPLMIYPSFLDLKYIYKPKLDGEHAPPSLWLH